MEDRTKEGGTREDKSREDEDERSNSKRVETTISARRMREPMPRACHVEETRVFSRNSSDYHRDKPQERRYIEGPDDSFSAAVVGINKWFVNIPGVSSSSCAVKRLARFLVSHS